MQVRQTAHRLNKDAQAGIGDALRHEYAGILNQFPDRFQRLVRRIPSRQSSGPGLNRGADRIETEAKSGQAYGPETLGVLQAAFDDAVKTLPALGFDATPDQLAKKLFDLATQGERRVSRLSSMAIVGLITQRKP